MLKIQWTNEAEKSFELLKNNVSHKKRYNSVNKTIKFLAPDPRHNSLQAHEFMSLKGPNGEKVFEAYAEHQTPVAYRVFWYYGPSHDLITIVAITFHP